MKTIKIPVNYFFFQAPGKIDKLESLNIISCMENSSVKNGNHKEKNPKLTD